MAQVTRLKSGGGCEIDSYGKRAGKGALVQTELSGTLGVSQDQTLFDAVSIGNGQLNQMSMDTVCNTLDTMHDKQAVLVMSDTERERERELWTRQGIVQSGQERKIRFCGGERVVTDNRIERTWRCNDETVGALCARDYKGVGEQYVREGKVIIQENRTPCE